MGTLYGPIIGAFVFLFSKDLISSYTEHWRLILGVIFVVFVIYSPRGIVLRREGVSETEATPSLLSDMNPFVERESSPKLKENVRGHKTGAGIEREE
jgi:branched-chain amino acid transport system permease protein